MIARTGYFRQFERNTTAYAGRSAGVAGVVTGTMVLPRITESIVVIGDLILDEYLIGKATRLSREAAVPVLERTRRHLVPGGAANPAVNLAGLDVPTVVVGVVGDDSAGEELCGLLRDAGVDDGSIVVDAGRPTTTKTRIVAEGGFVYGQHLARIDYLDRRPLSASVERNLTQRLSRLAASAGAFVLSNYRNGVMTDALIDHCRGLKAEYGVPLLVDSQGGLERFHGFDLVKCNRGEAEAELGAPLPQQPAARAEALADLRARCRADAVVVTLGRDGIAWMDDDGDGYAPPLQRATVFDTTGAGDTVIAFLALGWAADLSLARGCELANAAAGLTVQVLGNYAPTRDDVEAVVRGEQQDVPVVDSVLPDQV